MDYLHDPLAPWFCGCPNESNNGLAGRIYTADDLGAFHLPSQEDDAPADAPYVELVKHAEQLLQEGAMAAERQA